jgi:CelD/BcsL family acetyltransferase involved in cellulose biosynthesis
MFGLKRGTIEFIGTGHPTYSNFIISNEHDKCIQAFFEYLNTLPEKWVCAELVNLSQDRNSLLGLNKLSNSVRRGKKCLYTKLPSTNEAYLSTIKRKDKKEFRRNLRRLQNDGFKVELTDCLGANQINEGMNALFCLNQKRWHYKGFSGKFSDSNYCNFCLEVAKCFSEKGWLGLYNFELSGKPVASLFGFKYKSTYSAYITGMDPEYKLYGIGTLLFMKVIERCIQDGLAEFDFMWGTDTYKKQYNPASKYTFKASVPRNGVVSHLTYLFYKNYWSNGNRILYYQGKLLKSR